MAAGEAVSPEAETNCFGCSPNNAKGLGLVFDETDDAVVADVLLGRGYEGYPGVVHGGIVALILDEAMGRAIWRTDRRPALTLGLRVRYVDAMKTGAAYTVRGEVRDRDGEIIRARAEIEQAGEGVVAAADATFRLIAVERFIGGSAGGSDD